MKVKRFNENTEQTRLKIRPETKTILYIYYTDLIEFMSTVYNFDLDRCGTYGGAKIGEEIVVSGEEPVNGIRNNEEYYDDFTINECLDTLCGDGYIPSGIYVIES